MNVITMEQVIVEIIKQSPIIGILMWMVWKFQATIEKKDAQIQEAYKSLESVVINNTKAVVDSNNIGREIVKSNETLSARIYDVLAKHTQ